MAAARDSGASSGVKSAVRTLDLIEHVVAHPEGLPAQQIATSLAIPMSSLSYLLATLVERGYLHREGRLFLPGEGLTRLARSGPDLLVDRARPIIRALRRRFDETTSLFLPADWDMVVAMTETSGQSLRYAMQVDARVPLHAVAAGKAMLASHDDAAVAAYFAETARTRFTPHTLSDPALRRQIADIRRTGLATTEQEFTPGISGLGVAIVRNGRPELAIGIAAPSIRLDDELRRLIGDELLAAKRALEGASPGHLVDGPTASDV